MKKRIAIIIPGGISGGNFSQGIPVVEDFIQRLSLSFDVTVYSLIKTDSSYQPKNFRLRHTSVTHKQSSKWKLFLCSIVFIRDHLVNRYDLIHGIWGYPSGWMAVVLGKIFKIPSIVSIQGGEAANVPEINYGNMRTGKKKITLWTCKHADELTVLTLFQLNELRKYGFDRKVVHIIPYGADEKVFTFEKKILEPPFRFIHIANLNAVKDQITLLKAFKIISTTIDCSLRIIGDGEMGEHLKALAKELDIENRLTFLGAIPHKVLPVHLHWSHLMLHTSLYEGQGVVIAEAAASGVVVCGTTVGLLADWGITKCIAVNCHDYETLANEVLNLLKNPQKYEQLQKSAHEWALENTSSTVAISFQNIYNKMLL